MNSSQGVLFLRVENGELNWFENGNEDSDGKYIGEIKNGKQNGKGTYTFPDGRKYEGEFKDGKPWNGTLIVKNGNIFGKFVNGEWIKN
jgi:hypothetical protein